MGKKCAYCDREDVKITKEHVVNKALIDNFFKVGEGYANCFDDYTANYLTARDVCEECNNVHLGRLDEYFLGFLNNHLPSEIINNQSTLTINYDFDKLSKWLLKTLYNSERKNAYDFIPQNLKNFRQYILGKDENTKLFRIYFELLQDVPIEEIKKHNQLMDIETAKLSFLRVGNEVLSDEYRQGAIKTIIKHFTISNFVFHIFILSSEQNVETQFDEILKHFTNRIYYFNPDLSEIVVKPSARTIIDILEVTFEGDKKFGGRTKTTGNTQYKKLGK